MGVGRATSRRRFNREEETSLTMKMQSISDSKFGMLLSLPGLILLVLWVGIPLIILIGVSFLKFDVLQPIQFLGFDNYIYLFKDRVFRDSLFNTLTFFAGSTLLTFILAYPTAWSLSRIRKGSTTLRTFVMFPWAVPLIVSGFIWGWMFNAAYGVLNHVFVSIGLFESNVNFIGQSNTAMLAVIIADAWTRVPFMTILTLAGLEAIPGTLYESADI